VKLPYFSAKFVASLKAAAGSNMTQYATGVSWIGQFGAGQQHVRESNQIVDPPPVLVLPTDGPTKHDAVNARVIYEWLKVITPALAMEERLWAYLTHVTFAEYMSARWPVENAATVVRRYMFEGMSFAALSRNGIARLWWAGYLTRDESRPNQYELTEALFMRQDVQVALMERSLGKCALVRTSVLDFLRNNRELLGNEAFGRRIQRLVRELNLLGGVTILDSLPAASIDRFLAEASRKIVASESAGT
jgi:hypothetical protein